MAKMKSWDYISIIFLVVGGISWGFVGLFNFNLVSFLFGMGTLTKIVYGAIGVSALWSIYSLYKLH